MPFGSPEINRIKVISYVVLIVKLYVGLYVIAGGGSQVLVVTMAASNVVFLAYWVYNLFLQVLVISFQKSPSLFSLLSCGLIAKEKF
jgi:hypothetical protein